MKPTIYVLFSATGALAACLTPAGSSTETGETDKAASLIGRLWDHAVETSEACGLPRPTGEKFADFYAAERRNPGTGLAYYESLPQGTDACACAHESWSDLLPTGASFFYPFSTRLYEAYMAGETTTTTLQNHEWAAVQEETGLQHQFDLLLDAAGASMQHLNLMTGSVRPAPTSWLQYARVYVNDMLVCNDATCTVSAQAFNFWGHRSDAYSALHTFTITPKASYEVVGDEVIVRVVFSLYDYYDWTSYERGPWQAQLSWLDTTCGLAQPFAIEDATRDFALEKRFDRAPGGGLSDAGDAARWIDWPRAQRPAFMRLP